MLIERLESALLRHGDGPVVTISGSRGRPDHILSGNQLYEAAWARARALTHLARPEDGPLALVMPCGPQFVLTLFGALFAGFTVAAVSPPRPGVATRRFNGIISDCTPSAILCSDGLKPRIESALAGRDAPAPPVMDVEALPSRAQARWSPNCDPARPVILQYTSGSTRAPKAVALSGANVVANADLTSSTWGTDATDIYLTWLPHFHDMGLMGGFFFPLLSGGRSVLLDPLQMIQRPARWLRLISDHRATCSGGPAFAFAHCLQNVTDEQCAGLDLSSWTTAFCGAEPIPAELMSAFRDRFAPWGLDPAAVHGSYGLAEYTLMVAGGNPEQDAGRPPPPPGCAAIEPCRIAPEMESNLKLVDPDTRESVAAGAAGEIWMRGPSVAMGYRNEPAATAAAFGAVLADDGSRGWLRTGDIAVRSPGWLYVTGRLKDLLFANGRKIPATDVEWLAGEQDSALNPMAAAALMPDELSTGKAVLLIELKRRTSLADGPATNSLIRKAVASAWGIELTQIRVLPSGSLPRTTSGKIQRRLLAEAWRRGSIDELLQ